MKKEVIGWSSSSYETGDFYVNGFFFLERSSIEIISFLNMVEKIDRSI